MAQQAQQDQYPDDSDKAIPRAQLFEQLNKILETRDEDLWRGCGMELSLRHEDRIINGSETKVFNSRIRSL